MGPGVSSRPAETASCTWSDSSAGRRRLSERLRRRRLSGPTLRHGRSRVSKAGVCRGARPRPQPSAVQRLEMTSPRLACGRFVLLPATGTGYSCPHPRSVGVVLFSLVLGIQRPCVSPAVLLGDLGLPQGLQLQRPSWSKYASQCRLIGPEMRSCQKECRFSSPVRYSSTILSAPSLYETLS
jgi:hypothetical protein